MKDSNRTKKPKQLVSWTDYVKHLGVKTGASAFASIMFAFGGIGIAIAILFLLGCVADVGALMFGLGMSAVIGAMSSVLIYFGLVACRKVKEIPRVEPITNKNIVELPAQETLVRGASEPVSPQQGILLRPAQGASDAKEQELLRPR